LQPTESLLEIIFGLGLFIALPEAADFAPRRQSIDSQDPRQIRVYFLDV
jgi:hypothetical protein